MATSSTPWFGRVLGPDLARCSVDPLQASVSVDAALRPCPRVVGLYFLPIGGGSAAVDHGDFTARLLDLYKRLNEGVGEEAAANCDAKRLEIIQVALTNVDTAVVAITDSEDCFRKTARDLPWFAIPFHDMQRKARLCRRYRARAGCPSLVLLDGPTGRVVNSAAVEPLVVDPEGQAFPWRARPVPEVLKGTTLISANSGADASICFKQLDCDVTGIYFSAHWCPPCKAFTPQLIDTYNKVRSRGHKFEVIFVSSDRSEDSFAAYLSTMPWLAVPYEDADTRRELAALLRVQGIPSLVLLESTDGRIITDDGRALVNDDPDGLSFPWQPKLVNILTERYASKLHDHPAVILFVEGDEGEVEFAEAVLLPTAEEYLAEHQLDDEEDRLQFFIGCDSDTSDLLREFVGIDDAVPLLTAIDIPSGRLSVMEDGAEITEHSVRNFVASFCDGTLATTNIASNDLQISASSISII